MSNSFLPNKAPDVLKQETLERVLTALRQPFSIAVVASLALHGVLWATLPNILAETEKEPDSKQRVQTVELSPAEQLQLPSLGINPIPQTLLPAKPAKPAESGTKLPDPRLYNDPLYTLPSLQPPPIISFPSLDLPPIGFNFNQPPLPKPQKPVNPPKAPTEPPKAPTTPDASQTGKSSTSGSGESTSPVRPEKLSPEKIAALQEDAKRSRQLQALYTFNGSETDKGKRLGEILPKNAAAFETAVASATGGNYDDSSYRKTPVKVEIEFPKEACGYVKEPFIQEVQNASVAAYVTPDGKLAAKPGFLLTSGFPGLDDLAFNYVTKEPFKPSDKPRIVRFDFIFDPRPVCSKPSKDA